MMTIYRKEYGTKKYKDRIDKAYKTYCNEIERIAQEAQKEILNPYLDEHKLTFFTGNGTYVVFDDSIPYDYHHVEMEKLPKTVKNILQLEIDDYHNSELGLWMVDYPPKGK
jgi:hypothetical protein